MTSDPASAPTSRFPLGAAVTAAELEDDPHPRLARLREREPVSWLPALGGWLVTARDPAQRVLRDAAAYTVDDPRFSTAQVVGPSMLSLDGPVHTRHRDPFARPFRPAPTRERFTAFVAAEVDRLVSALAPAGRAELRGDLAGPLAVAVVAEALGLDGVDAATVRSWYGAFVEAVSAITAGGPAPARADEAYRLLTAAVEDAIRASRPGSLLAAAARDEAGLTTPEVVANAAILMFGGIDTTEGMIANAALHLLGHPDQLELVRADPGRPDAGPLDARPPDARPPDARPPDAGPPDAGLLDAAIEESLRLEPSAAVVDRYATRDAVLGAAEIRAGDLVRVSIAGANRDPSAFPDPDRFDVRRGNAADHLAFARGPHFCFGAHLARLEARTALAALLARLPGLRLDPARPSRPRGLVFRKPPDLHVRWDA